MEAVINYELLKLLKEYESGKKREDDNFIKRALKTATENLLKKLDRDFQAISGPGNLVNSIIWCYIKDKNFYKNIEILTDWDEKVVSKWPLDYRNDMRNWRNFKINME